MYYTFLSHKSKYIEHNFMRVEYYSTLDVLNNFIPNMVFERILTNKSKPIAKLLILFLEREREIMIL
jgi:hypothetical protein